MNKANTIRRMFSRQTDIRTIIDSSPGRIWLLLTNAEDFPRWNSTIIALNGKIEEGGRLELVSTLAPKRTFKLKIKEFVPQQRLAWGDAMGIRIFTLEEKDSGTEFSMTEKIGGPLFPLFSRMIPPFDESFEQFAEDLAKAACTEPSQN